MIELVILACVIGHACTPIPLTTTYQSQADCDLGARMLIPVLVAQHPEWWMVGWVCRVQGEEDT